MPIETPEINSPPSLDAVANFMDQPIRVGHIKRIIAPASVFVALLWWGVVTYIDREIIAGKIEFEKRVLEYSSQPCTPTPPPLGRKESSSPPSKR